MILIVGLGNPGPQYLETRHNVVFLALDAFLASRAGSCAVSFRPRFHGQYTELAVGDASVGLLKPETFMNASGLSVRTAASALNVEPEALFVLHDELDLPFAELRLKEGGGDGGHRGLRSISAELGSPNYGRLRIGIGRPPLNFQGDIKDFVLQAFALEERSALSELLASTSRAVESVILHGLSRTMNRTNQRTVR